MPRMIGLLLSGFEVGITTAGLSFTPRPPDADFLFLELQPVPPETQTKHSEERLVLTVRSGLRRLNYLQEPHHRKNVT